MMSTVQSQGNTQVSTPKNKSPARAGGSVHGSVDAKKSVEFRFHCSYDLRQRMNLRLRELNLERGDVMIGFLEEWLKQTDGYATSRKA